MENKHFGSMKAAAVAMNEAHAIYMAGSAIDVYAYDYTISYPDAATGRDETVIHIALACENIEDARKCAEQGKGLFADTDAARRELKKAGLTCVTSSVIR